MSPEEFSAKTQELLVTSQNELLLINARIARSALSLIRDRIINKGLDHTGKPLGKYSTHPLPTFFFAGKTLGSGGDKRLKTIEKQNRKVGINGVSYEQFRDANNLQTNHVDLKFSGDMWRDIDVLQTTIEGGIIKTIVASKDSITKKNGKGTITTGKEAEYMAAKYGDFLAVNEEEKGILLDALDEELQILVDKVFGK